MIVPKCGCTIPWPNFLDCLEKRKWAEHQHISLWILSVEAFWLFALLDCCHDLKVIDSTLKLWTKVNLFLKLFFVIYLVKNHKKYLIDRVDSWSAKIVVISAQIHQEKFSWGRGAVCTQCAWATVACIICHSF